VQAVGVAIPGHDAHGGSERPALRWPGRRLWTTAGPRLGLARPSRPEETRCLRSRTCSSS
jgi:hypothetical protein